MKAYVLQGIDNLVYKEVPEPVLQDGWALVKVKAAGICSSDIARIFTNGTYHFPTIPGHEFCGEVIKVYDEENKRLIGKRVGVFPLIPCKECEFCMKGQYEMCKNYNYLGSRCDGGFAEYVAAPVWNLIELPDNVSFSQAAILEPMSVAYHACTAANLEGVETAAIIGTGAIGLFIAMILRAKGIEVTIVGRNDEKKILADRCSIERYINLNNKDVTASFDLVFEAVGSNSSLVSAISLTKSGGQIVLVGNPSSDMMLEKKVYWQILRRQLKLFGTWNSQYENHQPCDWSRALELISNDIIDPNQVITHVFPKDKMMDGLLLMKDRKEPYGRVVVKFDE